MFTWLFRMEKKRTRASRVYLPFSESKTEQDLRVSGSAYGLDELNNMGDALYCEEVLETESSAALGSVDNSPIHC